MGVRRFILLGLAWSAAASLRSAEIEINGGEIRIQGNIMINGGELIQLDQGEGRASNQVESSEPDPADTDLVADHLLDFASPIPCDRSATLAYRAVRPIDSHVPL